MDSQYNRGLVLARAMNQLLYRAIFHFNNNMRGDRSLSLYYFVICIIVYACVYISVYIPAEVEFLFTLLTNPIVPTVMFKKTNDKISDFNDHDANKDFDTWDDTTGIQGTIQKLDIGYSAGEQHYTYQMVFAPIDMILG